MSVVYIVVPLALIVVLAAVLAFTWAARRGQFDDMTTPALRALQDDAHEERSAPNGAAIDADERPAKVPEA
jgi:cbb3-type cytochrome oxidase maturation protein